MFSSDSYKSLVCTSLDFSNEVVKSATEEPQSLLEPWRGLQLREGEDARQGFRLRPVCISARGRSVRRFSAVATSLFPHYPIPSLFPLLWSEFFAKNRKLQF